MIPINDIESNATSASRRTASLSRVTRETGIEGRIDLDSVEPTVDIVTGIGMLDHLMTAFAAHAGIDSNSDAKAISRSTTTTWPRIAASCSPR